MKAAWYEKHGPASKVLQIGEIETPEPREGELLVRLHASGANPSDVKARLGSRPVKWPKLVPHSDGAGVVEKVGSGVDSFHPGDRVWVFNGQWERPLGTAAECISLPPDLAVRLPDSVTFEEGACLGVPGMTAHRCLFSDGSVNGQTILVTGGAGAVGHYAVQLGKWGGATVITTVSSDEKAAHVRKAGADHVLNYRTEKVADRIREITNSDGVDRIVDVDFGDNLPVTQSVLKENGTVTAYASTRTPEPVFPYYPLMRANVHIRLVYVYTMPDEAKRQACADIVQAIEDGKLVHAVAARFPLEKTAAAHSLIESGNYMDNVVITIG